MEILRIYAHEYVQKAVRFHLSIGKLRDASIWNDNEHRQNLALQLEELRVMCQSGELPVTKVMVDHILHCFKTFDDKSDPIRADLMAKSMSDDLLQQYLFRLRHTLEDELSTKFFFQLTNSKKEYFEAPQLGWEAVIDRFPDVLGNVEELSKCFAFSRYAACVFHSLLVVERGLIELGREIGVTDPKPGWDATCGMMQKLVNGGHNEFPAMRIGFSTLEQINQSAQSMKHAWRNKVNHAAGQLTVIQAEFAPDVAEEIMLATRAFMRRLATDLPKPGV